MRVGLPTIALLLLPRSAGAFFELASDGNVGAKAAKVVVEDDGPKSRWTVAVELEGKASRVGLVFLLPAGVTGAELALPAKLVDLEHRTAPTIKKADAIDPCAPAPPQTLALSVESAWAPAPGAFSIEPLAIKNQDELAAWLSSKGLKLSDDARALAARHAAAGGALYGLFGTWPKKAGTSWLPAVSFAFGQRTHALPLGIAAPFAPVGRALRVSLYTVSSGAPALVPRDVRVADLATGIALPEIAIDVAPDLIRLFSDQIARRERVPVAVRIATVKAPGPAGAVRAIGRYELQLGRRAVTTVVTLAEDPTVLVFAVEWSSTPPFRKPMKCPIADRYRHNARLQLQTELRTYATLTGRSLPDVVIESEKKGYTVPK